jgi:hypothetical protein
VWSISRIEKELPNSGLPRMADEDDITVSASDGLDVMARAA